MDWFDADGYTHARWLLQRGVAVVYAVAFLNILTQWPALAGQRGLLPAGESLRHARGFVPTVFRRGCSDPAALSLGWVGLAVSLLVVVGVPQLGPWWLPMLAFGLLWSLYLSYVTIGGVWYAFGWESLLLEAGVLVAFLGSDEVAPPWLVLLLVRWLVFRVEFGAGLIKLRGDACWRKLTCLDHHHETQPLPNRLSRWFHHLPRPIHRVEVAANHVAQLMVPFGLFLPQPIAGVSATAIIVTQAWLVLSGNFAWLNLLTMVLATAALPGAWFGAIAAPVGPFAPPSMPFVVAVVALSVLVVVLSLRGPIPNLLALRGSQAMNTSHDPLRLVNSYGAFGSITRVRHELVIEATRDDPRADGAAWYEYGFRAKPGDPRRAPRQVAPYHLRLDWLMWFAAMDPVPTRHRWFQRLLHALADADPQVIRLLAHDPLAGRLPTAVRVLRYRYRYTTREERRETGDWWVRDRREQVAGPVRSQAGDARGGEAS